MLNIIVRAALECSVTCRLPSVKFQISHVSMVPASRSPRSAFSRAPSTLSRIQAIFDAE